MHHHIFYGKTNNEGSLIKNLSLTENSVGFLHINLWKEDNNESYIFSTQTMSTLFHVSLLIEKPLLQDAFT